MLYAERLEWAGHMWRVEEKMIKSMVIKTLPGKRSRGRPQHQWMNRVVKYITAIDESKNLED